MCNADPSHGEGALGLDDLTRHTPRPALRIRPMASDPADAVVLTAGASLHATFLVRPRDDRLDGLATRAEELSARLARPRPKSRFEQFHAEKLRPRQGRGDDHPTINDLHKAASVLGRSVVIANLVDVAVQTHDRPGSPDEIWEIAGRLSPAVPVHKLRYQSPLELALLVPPVVIASRLALEALILTLRRLYNLELEIRTDHEDKRAAFYEARKRARQAERAWLDGDEPPEDWPADLLTSVCVAMAHRELDVGGKLKLKEIVLVVGDDEPPGVADAEPRG